MKVTDPDAAAGAMVAVKVTGAPGATEAADTVTVTAAIVVPCDDAADAGGAKAAWVAAQAPAISASDDPAAAHCLSTPRGTAPRGTTRGRGCPPARDTAAPARLLPPINTRSPVPDRPLPRNGHCAHFPLQRPPADTYYARA